MAFVVFFLFVNVQQIFLRKINTLFAFFSLKNMKGSFFMYKITRKTGTDITFKEAKKEFISFKKSEGLSTRTIESYDYAIDYFICTEELTSDDFVSVITQDLLIRFIAKMQEKQITKSGMNHFINTLRVFLYWLMDENYIQKFPIKLIKGQEPKIKIYTDEELKRLMEKPKKDCYFGEHRQWVMVAFILSCGARANTIVNIKVEDIDFVNSTVTYTHLKNKKSVIIPIPMGMAKIIKEYIRTWGINDYLFPNNQNEQMSYNALESSFKRYCNNRRVKCIGLHALRHTFCSSLVKQNVSPFIIQKIMTHSSIAVTEKYVHLFGPDLEKVSDAAPINMFINENKKITRHK